MTSGINVAPVMLKWARQRANKSIDEICARDEFKNYARWEQGETKPTFKKLQSLASFFMLPFGYFFLKEPPEDEIPIKDFRTVSNKTQKSISLNLREIIYRSKIGKIGTKIIYWRMKPRHWTLSKVKISVMILQ